MQLTVNIATNYHSSQNRLYVGFIQSIYVWNANNIIQSDSNNKDRQDVQNSDRLVRRPGRNDNIAYSMWRRYEGVDEVIS